MVIKLREATIGGFKIRIDVDPVESVQCGLVKIEIPYMKNENDIGLTDSNDFSFNADSWTVSTPPYPTQGATILINVLNDFGFVPSGERLFFHLYKIRILSNPEGLTEREVSIRLKFYRNPGDEQPFFVQNLNLTLVNEKAVDPSPRVDYFAVDRFKLNPRDDIVNLYWNISHGKDMVLYPNFLGDEDQPRVRGMEEWSDQSPQPIRIDRAQPISITHSSGSIKVQIVRSTQFKLVADNEGNRGTAELTTYLLQQTNIFFKVKSPKELYSGAEPITLEWANTFNNPMSLGNELYLIARAYQNADEWVQSIKEAPDGKAASWVKDVRALSADGQIGQLTFYPTSPTEFTLFNKDGESNQIKINTFKIMTINPNTPVGSIMMYGGKEATPPYGWMWCDGKELSKEDFVKFFMENYEKQHENETDRAYREYIEQSFDTCRSIIPGPDERIKLPPVIDRFVVAAGKEYAPYDEGGKNTYKLELDQLPSHDHGGKTGEGYGVSKYKEFSYYNPKQNELENPLFPVLIDYSVDGAKKLLHTHEIASQGKGASIENRPEYIAMWHMVKVLL